MKINYFNFKKLGDKILMTNDFGRYILVSQEEFKKILKKDIEPHSDLWEKLIESRMIYDQHDIEYSALNRYDIRQSKEYLNVSTSLHIFVVTTSCNMSCMYCQANNGRKASHLYMDKNTAERAVDIALQSPALRLDFEFQGGEPLLNVDIIKHIVEYAEQNKGRHIISYNVVTNLTLLTDEILDFLEMYHFGISTSLDGPKKLHNINRPFCNGEGTYDKVVKSINKIRERGLYIGAIETTTRASLSMPEELIDTYLKLGFDSIFIRPLTQLGKATVNWKEIGYSAEEFLTFYKRAMEYLIEVNKAGKLFRENHASILLSKIDGQFVNYMELRSPCGAAIGQMAYYSDGNIFTCDEGRMLYEMGEDAFKLGNVFENTYEELIHSGVCKTVCSSSMLETIPTCCDCVYQPYCGTCPVANYAQNNDIIEKSPREYRCKIYSGMLDYLFLKLTSSDKETVQILNAWSN